MDRRPWRLGSRQPPPAERRPPSPTRSTGTSASRRSPPWLYATSFQTNPLKRATAAMPVLDDSAGRLISQEAKQLPKNVPSVVCLDIGAFPGGPAQRDGLIRRRLATAHGRIGAVVVYSRLFSLKGVQTKGSVWVRKVHRRRPYLLPTRCRNAIREQIAALIDPIRSRPSLSQITAACPVFATKTTSSGRLRHRVPLALELRDDAPSPSLRGSDPVFGAVLLIGPPGGEDEVDAAQAKPDPPAPSASTGSDSAANGSMSEASPSKS